MLRKKLSFLSTNIVMSSIKLTDTDEKVTSDTEIRLPGTQDEN